MSYPTPRRTPERQRQLLAEREPSPEPSPSSPSRNRALAVLSSPVKFLRGLGHPTSSPYVVSPPQSVHSQFQEHDNEDEVQCTSSSRSASESNHEERNKHHIYARALAPLKSSRQRQKARLRRVNRLISFIEELQNESYLGSQETISTQLFPKDYIQLLVEIDERDIEFQYYFNHALRYEYRESRYGKNQFTIFMLSAFHIRMQGLIDREVGDWRARVKNNDGNAVEVKIAADKIMPSRDISIESDNKLIRPDCSFNYEGVESYPSLAFEIGWSQSTDALKRRALELIQETAGQTRTVVGLDFSETYNIWAGIRDHVGTEELPNRGPATAFIWRAVFDENGQQVFNADGQPRLRKKNYKFCSEDGTVQQREKLQLSLKDFVPLQVISAEGWDGGEALENTKLEFDSATIVKFFDNALGEQKAEDKRKGPRREKKALEKLKIRQDQEARRRIAAENAHEQRSILNKINIGGYDLRRMVRRR
ncbi:hypothetical protein F4801DRAFT_556638 [Xylaria longipes]|nr:hypothetical protein F4801DRAFT_556638 [Xylaria longipes]RYC62579.1 hypothetical protein CHU98_g3630 [Xylaria longipes]